MNAFGSLGQGEVLGDALADVAAARERARRRRLRWLTAMVSLLAAWLWVQALAGRPALPLPAGLGELAPMLIILVLFALI
ncbi:MAG: hypothetical protein H0V52_10535, partial [Acidimicrobiia bacterium]|nr:hypothetical protein [Acidimicrobiia bacterium]